ncbi:MAG TPA: hypothetical protein VF750_00790 [Sphingomicrobium sp.]
MPKFNHQEEIGMAQHGYLREYDEGWDRGSDRDRERERGWRDDDRERGWRGSSDYDRRDRGWEDDSSDRNRNFMLGDRDRNLRRGDHDRDRGFFDRMGDEARSWFRDDDRQYRGTHHQDREHRGSGYGREHGFGGFQGDYGRSGQSQGGFGGSSDWERSPRNFSSHQDDHYRSWRDRQMSALDADYQDYCREREQQFHQDFDSWRKNRQSQGQGGGQQRGSQTTTGSSGQQQTQGSTGQQTGQGQGGSSPEVMELNNPTRLSTEPQSAPSPVADATLGTNNSENTGRGRR